jgi:hypothetical protein
LWKVWGKMKKFPFQTQLESLIQADYMYVRLIGNSLQSIVMN